LYGLFNVDYVKNLSGSICRCTRKTGNIQKMLLFVKGEGLFQVTFGAGQNHCQNILLSAFLGAEAEKNAPSGEKMPRVWPDTSQHGWMRETSHIKLRELGDPGTINIPLVPIFKENQKPARSCS
jgi:hypothetical protein